MGVAAMIEEEPTHVPPPRGAAGCCVIVAGVAGARIYAARPAADSRPSLVPHADVSVAGSLTGDRDFVDAVIARAVETVSAAQAGRVVLVAPARVLALLREPLQHVLGSGVPVMALARDYTALSARELAQLGLA